MTPTRDVLVQMANLLAEDTTTLANAYPPKVRLSTNSFTESIDLAIGDMTEATFSGYSAISVTGGSQDTFYDAQTGELVISIKQPAGGFTFLSDSEPAEPETITGYYLTNLDGTVLLGAKRLVNDVTIDTEDQGLDIGDPRFAVSLTALS